RPPWHFECVLPLYPRPRWPSARTVHQRLFHRRSRSRAVALVAEGPAPADLVGRAGAALLVRAGLALRGPIRTRAGLCRRCHDRGLGAVMTRLSFTLAPCCSDWQC